MSTLVVIAETDLPALPESVRVARGWLRDMLAGRPEAVVFDDAQVCLDEFITNSVLHSMSGVAGVDGRVGIVKVTVLISATRTESAVVRVEVTDAGPIDAGSRPHPREASQTSEDGRGLCIVAALANRWGCEVGDASQTIWCEVATR